MVSALDRSAAQSRRLLPLSSRSRDRQLEARPYYSYNTVKLARRFRLVHRWTCDWRGQGDEHMATDPATGTETATKTKLKLDPPEALQPIAVHEAAGLVPLKTDETSELDQKVAKF